MASPLLRVLLAGLVLTALVTPRAQASTRVDAGEHAVAAAPGAELPASTRSAETQGITQGTFAPAPRFTTPRSVRVLHCVGGPELAPAEGHPPAPREYLPRRHVASVGDDGHDH